MPFFFTLLMIGILIPLSWLLPASLDAFDYLLIFACVFGLEGIVGVVHRLKKGAELPQKLPGTLELTTSPVSVGLILEYSCLGLYGEPLSRE